MGNPTPAASNAVAPAKGKGILGEDPPGSTPKDPLEAPTGGPSHDPLPEMGSASMQSRKLDCPRFHGTNFRGWWSKLEQYFEAEGVADNAKVREGMLHLEGRTLDWHHFYTYRGLHMLNWT